MEAESDKGWESEHFDLERSGTLTALGTSWLDPVLTGAVWGWSRWVGGGEEGEQGWLQPQYHLTTHPQYKQPPLR